jgi:glycosyltransferase involved in cell wall biosynthesis
LAAVSVLTPVFNAGEFIAPALESLRAQTFADWELIAVDDGSRDDSAKTLRRFAKIDNRIRPIFQKENRGIPATRNFGLTTMRGEYFAFLNHDDVALPERFAKQLAFLRAHEDVDLVGSAIENVDARGERINVTPMPESDLEIRWMALFDCPIRHSALMGRASAFVDLRYDESLPINSDYDLLSRAIRKNKAANLPEVLVQYRKHPRNTSRVRHKEFIENGVHISRAAILHEFPEYKIDNDDIAVIRATLLNYKKADASYSVAEMNRALELYLDLFDAFAEKYRDHPLLARLCESVTRST